MARMAGRFVSWFTQEAKAFKPTPGKLQGLFGFVFSMFLGQGIWLRDWSL